MEEVEKREGGSFPSNYVTIHQLRQRWLQQQQQSSSSSSLSLSSVLSESNHRDDDDVDVEFSSAASKKKHQNDVVSAHSPPAVTKSPSYNNKKNKASSSNPNQQQPPLSPISSSGGSKKKPPQNDAVSPPPPANTKSPSSSHNNNNKPPLISQQNHHHNEIVSKTLNQSLPPPHLRRGHRLLASQKPKPQLEPEPEPEPADNVLVTTLNTVDSATDDVDNHINTVDSTTDDVDNQINTVSIKNNNKISKKKNHKKTLKAKGVFPDQSHLTGPQTDPKPELESEVEAVVVVVEKEQESRRRRKSNKKAVRESKMPPELVMEVEQVVVEKQQQQLRESRGRRDWDKKVGREFKDKTASFDQNKHAVGNNVVEPEPEPELQVEMEMEAVVVVEKTQKPRETRGRRNWDNKAVREFKPKTASFGQYDYNNTNVDNNVDVGVKAVEVDKVVGDGDVVKDNSRRGSGKFDHQGQGKQSLKAASFDRDINVTGDGGSNWKRGSGRFRGQGIQRPLYLKPLIETRKGQVWVKKGESTTPN